LGVILVTRWMDPAAVTDPQKLGRAPVRYALRVFLALVTGIVVGSLLLPGSAPQPVRAAAHNPTRDWLDGGGGLRVDAVVDGIAGLVKTANGKSAGFESMRRAAGQLLAIVEDVDTYAEPPGGEALRAWHAGLLSTATAARMVIVAIDTLDVPLMERAIDLLSNGYRQLHRLRPNTG
jgi:hypothetical protein